MADLGVIAVVSAYVGLLLLLALWAERAERRGRRVASNALVYSLSLAVYCTTWTYYGSVGFAASTGPLFLTVYLGPTLVAIGGWWLLRLLVRIKNAHRITSIADLLALRFAKSQAVGGVATVLLGVGLVPYIALQLKTMIATTATLGTSGAYPAVGARVGPPIVILMLVFTIAFGIRHLSPTERHPGIVVALAAECIVVLVAFLAVGAFVTYGLFNGFADVFQRAARSAVAPRQLGGAGVTTWLSYLLLSSSAILMLPRQFHVAVVENSDEQHVRTAMWLFPAYLVAINVFVLPVALGGLLLGLPRSLADTFVLEIPHRTGHPLLSWFVYLGGFSAGTGMVVVETMALATMISNHLLLPAAAAWRGLTWLRRHLLLARWGAAALVLLVAFGYERAYGMQYELVSIGLTSFAAVLQLAPSLIGGLLWKGASRAGALTGLIAGFGVWAYTLVLPVLVRGGDLPAAVLSAGPAGIGILRPEALFGVGGLDPLSNAVLWSMIFNIGGLVIGSLVAPAAADEEARAAQLARVLATSAPRGDGAPSAPLADANEKRDRIAGLLAQYHPDEKAACLADDCLRRVGAVRGERLTAVQLSELKGEVETTLASAIGTAAAHAALEEEPLVSEAEAHAISKAYAEILSTLEVPPAELLRRVDYQRERGRLLARTARNQRFLAGVSARLAASLDLDAAARTVVRLAVPQLSEAALLWLAPGDAEPPGTWVAHANVRREQAFGEAVRRALQWRGGVLLPSIARALETHRAQVIGSAENQDWRSALAEVAPRSTVVVLPLVAPRGAIGALALFPGDPPRLALPDELWIAEELSHRSAIALENARLYREAREAIRVRDEFLAMASHELKTPITPLAVSVQTLRRLAARGALTQLPPERASKLLRSADDQIRRLTRLVDDLLDVSRITAHRLRLDRAPTDLAAVVREVVERHRAELAQAGCEVRLATAPAISGCWDRLRIEQVTANLLVNAGKYAPGKPVDVMVEADELVARLVVRDHGPGIAPADRERIFRPFERATPPLQVGGFGLGLYIVRQLVEAHAGTVRLDSEEGRGTTFTVELPRGLSAADERRADSAAPTRAGGAAADAPEPP